ncbi:MAG: hypothetical protein EAZ14_12420 [Runella slithyformis]|nr:MAG: hypothetical protein EAZ46_11020 [Runella sp.]TAG17071.1 MAG: hypothetical protein EAZ38_17995 [Cytophagales bacterium]TAG36215.1 MAG: hypothetical protein EAZ32_17430 [Cytophagia bacterium]TAG58455.1 MAG: hypothetical protein EAZ29_00900 [Runella slithyformis]TAG64920.1 MAG: hypothetical protein EAZ26_10840 [Runella slithyformis]
MKRSNILLTAVVFITISVQVLLVYGYKAAFLKEISYAKTTEFGLFPKGNIKAVKVEGMRLMVYLGAQKPGYKHDYRRVGLSFSMNGDTLTVSKSDKTFDADAVFCSLYFNELPTLLLSDAHASVVASSKTYLDASVQQNSTLAFSNGSFVILNANVSDNSTLKLSTNTHIDNLTLQLNGKAILQDSGADIKKLQISKSTDSSEINLSGKALQTWLKAK